MKPEMDSSRKLPLHESGQATMEAILLLIFTFLTAYVFFNQVTVFMSDFVLTPISQMMGDTVRFGNHNENFSSKIEENNPDLDTMNPFHGERNAPLHL